MGGGDWVTPHTCAMHTLPAHMHRRPHPEPGAEVSCEVWGAQPRPRPGEVIRSHPVSAASASTKVPAVEAGKLGGTPDPVCWTRMAAVFTVEPHGKGRCPGCCRLGVSQQTEQTPGAPRRSRSPSSLFVSPLLWGSAWPWVDASQSWTGQPQETCQWLKKRLRKGIWVIGNVFRTVVF